MQKKWLLLAGFMVILIPIIAFMGCSASSNQGNSTGPLGINLSNQQQGIWVNGQGKVTVTPDIANLSLGIEVQAETVSQAQAEAASAMDDVMNALTNNGVDRKDIQTQYFNIRQVTRWDRDKEEEVITGYMVTNMVAAKIRDIDEVGAVVDAVAEAGRDLTRIDNISFTVDDPSEYYEEARQNAMVDAKTKAEQLAELANVNLGKPTYIYEGSQVPTPRYAPVRAVEYAPGAPVETPISPGEMEISLSLQISYNIL